VLLGLVFLSVSWPYNDVHNMFRDAEAMSWRQTLLAAFGRGVEYRPLLTLSVKLAYELAGLRLWLYQAAVLVQSG
jgi:hypothetical protein